MEQNDWKSLLYAGRAVDGNTFEDDLTEARSVQRPVIGILEEMGYGRPGMEKRKAGKLTVVVYA